MINDPKPPPSHPPLPRPLLPVPRWSDNMYQVEQKQTKAASAKWTHTTVTCRERDAGNRCGQKCHGDESQSLPVIGIKV